MESIESKNRSCKNDITKQIRDALVTPSDNVYPNIDRTRLFARVNKPYHNFKSEFEQAGGTIREFIFDKSRLSDEIYVLQSLNAIYQQIKYAIEVNGWNRVLNVSSHLSANLAQFHIDTVETLAEKQTADAVIVYAEYLIARTGHLAFSQRPNQNRYPSIRGLAPNIIVLSGNTNIVSDLKDLTDRITTTVSVENRLDEQNMKFNLLELIRPTRRAEDEPPTLLNPQITLLMLLEK